MRNPFRRIRDDDDDLRPVSSLADKMVILFAAVLTLCGIAMAIYPPDFSVLDSAPAAPPQAQAEPEQRVPADEVLVPIYTAPPKGEPGKP